VDVHEGYRVYQKYTKVGNQTHHHIQEGGMCGNRKEDEEDGDDPAVTDDSDMDGIFV
jgi:hypothetical protein